MSKIKVGYAQDWCQQATLKYQIIDETISRAYVCRAMPIQMTRLDGSTYWASPNSGIFLRDKKDFSNITEEEINE